MSILETQEEQQQQLQQPFQKNNKQQNKQIKSNGLSTTYFVLQGVISLLGYNAILGSLDYFANNFSDYNIYFYLPLPPMITFNIISIIMPQIAQRIKYPIRITICIISMMIILILLPITTNYLQQTGIGFILIMILSLIWGVFGQIFNSSLIGLSCTIDRNQVVAYNIGSSGSGIIIILLRIIVVSVFNDDINLSTLIYFLSAGFINLIGVVLHLFYIRSIQYNQFRKKSKQSLIYQQEEVFLNTSRQQSEINNQENNMDGNYDGIQNNSDAQLQENNDALTNAPQTYEQKRLHYKEENEKTSQDSIIESQNDNNKQYLLKQDNNDDDELNENEDDNKNKDHIFERLTMKEQFLQYLIVAKTLKYLPLFMLLSNICANMMYPAVSLKSSLNDIDYTWSCIWIIFMHNISNVIGKYLTIIRILYNPMIIYSMVIFRFLHFIIFIINASDTDSVLQKDWIIALNIILFSFSAGYTDGAMFILAAEKMQTNVHREQGGFIMAFSLTFGIMIGIFLAMSFQNI